MKQINTFTYPVVKFSGGRWFIEYKLNGKRKRKYYTIDKRPRFYGEQLARKIANELKEINAAPGPLLWATVQNCLDAFNGRPETVKTYKYAAGVLRLYLNDMPLQAVDKQSIAIALNKAAAARGWGASSKAAYTRYIKAVFGMLVNNGYLSANPAKGIKTTSEQSKRHVLLTVDEISKIKSYCLKHSAGVWGVCQLVYYCGLRPAEILRLQDQDFKEGKVFLSANNAKNKKAVSRLLPVDFAGLPRFGKVHLYRIFKECREREGLRAGVSVYSFRHTAAVRLYEATKDIKQVQFFLRHSSISITDNYLRNLGIVEDSAAAGLPLI